MYHELSQVGTTSAVNDLGGLCIRQVPTGPAVVAGSYTHGPLKRPTEGAVVVESAAEGDVRDRVLGFTQKAGGRRQSGLGDELTGREIKETPNQAGEPSRREVGLPRERGRGNRLRKVVLKVIEYPGHAWGNFARIDRGTKVPGDADEPDDLARRIAQRQFGGQAPHGLLRQVPLLFEMINQGNSGPQYALILFRRQPAKIAAADLARAPVQYLRLVPKAVAFDQGVIHGEIAAGGVLDEESQIRRVVK